MHGVDWDDVRVLLAIFRARNQDDAARALGVDRSTISRRLAVLERSLGARLFVRTPAGVRPTDAALRLRPHAERMETEATGLATAAAAREERVSGLVRIATTEALGLQLVTRGLLRFCERHPLLVLEILGSNRVVDLARGEADVALRVSPVHGASLRVRCVARSAVGLFASPGYLQRRGGLRSPSALRGHDVLLPSGELARLPESRWLASRPGARVALRSNSMPVLVAAARDGRGIVPLGVGWGDDEPGLERLALLDKLPKRAIWLVTTSDGATRAAVKLVTDRIATLFGRTPAAAARAPAREE
jgi:DNA-binding transcriptional LysR family regulator